MLLYLDRVCQRGLHTVLWSHIGTLMQRLAAEPCSTAGLLFPSRCPSGSILLTPYSMVWDWRVSRAGPMLLYWPKLLYPYTIVLYSFSLSLLSVYRLVLCGWGLRTDRVYITLSQPCTANLFFNNNNNNNNNNNGGHMSQRSGLYRDGWIISSVLSRPIVFHLAGDEHIGQ